MPKWILEDQSQNQPQMPTQPQAPTQSPQEGYLDQAKRVGTAAGFKGLEGLQSLLFGLPELLLGKRPSLPQEQPGGEVSMQQAQYPSEIIQQKAGISPEYLQARNAPERFLQRFATSALPSLLTGGLGAVGRTAVGSAAGTGLGELGLPEWAQDVGQLGTEIGVGLIPKKALGPIGSALGGRQSNVKQVRKIEEALTKAAINPNERKNAKAITDSIKHVADELKNEMDATTYNKVRNVLEKVENNLFNESAKPSEIVSAKKALDRVTKNFDPELIELYIDPLKEGIDNFFAIHAAENPKFFNHMKAAEKLKAFENMSTILPKFAEATKLIKIPGGKEAVDLISFIPGSIEKLARGLLGTNNQARKYYFNLVTTALEDNPILFVKNANKLSKMIPEFNQQKNGASKNVWVLE